MNPFVGPKPLSKDNPVFGREREIRELLYLMVSERIVLLHSPSGAGKSSLIQGKGGLLELLGAQFDVWRPTRVHQAPDGFLARNRYSWSAAVGLEQELPEEMRREPGELAQMSLKEYVGGRPRQSHAPRALIFDQFEEVLRVDVSGVEEKREFFREIGELLSDPLIWALFVIREDYLAPLDPYARLVPAHLQNRYRIDLFKQSEAAEAIAKTAGGRFSKKAVEKLARDLAAEGEYVEPLQLQVVCRGLWEEVEKAGVGQVEERHVEQYGKVGEALSNYYANAVEKIGGGLARERMVREWVGERLIAGEIRSLVLRGATQSAGLANGLVDELVDTHLVRREPRGGAVWYELAHDRLIRPVKENNAEWMERYLHWVQKRVAAWEAAGEPDGMLLPEQAAEVEEWAKEQGVLTEGERRFVEETKRLAATRRRDRIRNRLVAGLAVAALIGMGVAWVFYGRASVALNDAEIARGNALIANSASKFAATEAEVARVKAVEKEKDARESGEEAKEQRGRAETQTRTALARQAATQAGLLAVKSFDRAVLLALTAVEMAGEGEASDPVQAQAVSEMKASLLSLLVSAENPAFHLWGHSDSVNSVTFSAYGRFAATADDDGNIQIWDARTWRIVRKIEGQSRSVTRLALRADGKILAGMENQTVVWFDLTAEKVESKRLVRKPPGEEPVRVPEGFTDDGRLIVTVSGFVEECEPGGECRRAGKVEKGIVQAGNRCRVSYESGQLDVTDLTGKPMTPPFRLQAAALKYVALAAVSEDCQQVALKGLRVQDGRGQHTLILVGRQGAGWKQEEKNIDANEGELYVFSPDKRRLAWVERDRVTVVDLSTRESKQFKGRGLKTHSLAFTRDGSKLAAGGEDGGVAGWDLDQPYRLAQVLGTATVERGVFSPDGKRVATLGKKGDVSLWDIGGRQPEGMAVGNCGAATAVTFDGKGKLVVVLEDRRVVYAESGCGVVAEAALDGSREVGYAGGTLFGRSERGGWYRRANRGELLPRGILSTGKRWYLRLPKENDKKIALFDLERGEWRELDFPDAWLVEEEPEMVVFSRDERTVAIPRLIAGTVSVWDMERRVSREVKLPEPMSVAGLDGDLLVTQTEAELGGKMDLFFWRLPGLEAVGDPVPTFGGSDGTKPPHVRVKWVAGLAVTADAVGASLRDRRTAQALSVLPLMEQPMTVSADGQKLFGVLNRGEGVVWDLARGRWKERACAAAGRNLREAEWRHEFGALPYAEACPDLPTPADVLGIKKQWLALKQRVETFVGLLVEGGEGTRAAAEQAVRNAVPPILQAARMKPAFRIEGRVWANLCHGGLWFGMAKHVEEVCETAGQVDAESHQTREYRAANRILLGKAKAAEEDLQWRIGRLQFGLRMADGGSEESIKRLEAEVERSMRWSGALNDPGKARKMVCADLKLNCGKE